MSGVKLGSNINSLTAQRYLARASERLSAGFEKLSSGMRINKASDDAAALAISSNLNASVRVTTQALRNLSDGLSLANIAEGALGELRTITLRQRELATQAANGAYTIVQRQAMNAEANKLVDEYNRIIGSTEFNGTQLFCSDPESIRIQAGLGIDGSLLFSIGNQMGRNVGDGTFQSQAVRPTGSVPVSLATYDFNRDGYADIVTANYGEDTVGVLLGDGNGGFEGSQFFPVGSGPIALTLGDFNGDGKADIVTANATGDNISICLGKGDGSFQSSQEFSVGDNPSALAAGDINNDGKIDILTADRGDGRVSVLLGNGDGTFQARQVFSTGLQPSSVVIGDFNGDGKMDMATTDAGSQSVSVMIGNGDGTFKSRQAFSVGVNPYSMSVADFDGDGRFDIVTADTNSSTASVLLGNCDGTFQARRILTTGGTPYSVAIGDFNGDGRSDIATVDGLPDTVSVFMGNGDGTFQDRRAFATGSSPMSLVLGDFNGDNRIDIVAANAAASSASILLANGLRVSTISYLNLNSRQGALDAMSVVDQNLMRIENEFGAIGAVTSRFAVALATLQATRENEAAASSRITDVDVAGESAEMIKTRILQQVAVSVLGQANQAPQLALLLLQ